MGKPNSFHITLFTSKSSQKQKGQEPNLYFTFTISALWKQVNLPEIKKTKESHLANTTVPFHTAVQIS